MRRNSLHVTTLVILLSIFSVAIQFGTYYLFNKTIFSFIISTIIVLLCSHVLLEYTLNHESCFSYTLLNIFICFIIIGLSYFNKSSSYLSYHPRLFLFIGITLLLPLTLGILRSLLDRARRYSNFNSFFRNTSILVTLIYISILIYFLIYNNKEFVLYYSDYQSINYIPLLTLATLLEDYLDGYMTIRSILMYLTLRIVLFIPYGFFMALLLKKYGRVIKTLSFLILPLIIEIIQRIFSLGKCDLDDVIFGFIGSFIGAIFYTLLNGLFRYYTDEDFLDSGTRHSFYGNSLYF